MICQYQGHSFVTIRTFNSDIYAFNDSISENKGTQKFKELVCHHCGGTVLEEVENGWTPNHENKTTIETDV